MKGLLLLAALVASAAAFTAPGVAWHPRAAAARGAPVMAKGTPKIGLVIGEKVTVITGDEKGKTGKVLKIDKSKKNGPYVLVEGLNIVTKHQKATSREKVGEILKKEALIHISNLKGSGEKSESSNSAVVDAEPVDA